jgi:hypothetical protein
MKKKLFRERYYGKEENKVEKVEEVKEEKPTKRGKKNVK